MSEHTRTRLRLLADQLDPVLARELRRLVSADSRPARVLELEERAQRAEDLACECQRQLRSLSRLYDAEQRVSRLERTVEGTS